MRIAPAISVTLMALVITSLFSFPAFAVETSITCDVVQGFQFNLSQTTPVGHLTYLKIGDTELGADLSVTNPEDPTGDATDVVGVMDDIYWEGGYADSIHLTARLSVANKNAVMVLLHLAMSDTRIQLRFDVYDYDVIEGKYYKAFHTNTVTVAGYIESSAGDPQIDVDMEQAMDVVSPANFSFFLTTAADDIVGHDLHLAVSVSDKLVKQWGVASGPAPDISTSVTTIDFGTVQAGQTPSKILTVYNDGTGNLGIGVVGLSDSIEAPYLITADTCSSQSIGPGGSCAVTVTFGEPLAVAADLPAGSAGSSLAEMAGGAMGLVIAGLMFAGGPRRRNRATIVLVCLALAGAVLGSCAGASSSDEERTEYVGGFDIPSDDPDSPTVTVGVVGSKIQ